MSGTKSGFVGVLQSALRGIRAFEEALERTPYDDLYDRVRHLEGVVAALNAQLGQARVGANVEARAPQ